VFSVKYELIMYECQYRQQALGYTPLPSCQRYNYVYNSKLSKAIFRSYTQKYILLQPTVMFCIVCALVFLCFCIGGVFVSFVIFIVSFMYIYSFV